MACSSISGIWFALGCNDLERGWIDKIWYSKRQTVAEWSEAKPDRNRATTKGSEDTEPWREIEDIWGEGENLRECRKDHALQPWCNHAPQTSKLMSLPSSSVKLASLHFYFLSICPRKSSPKYPVECKYQLSDIAHFFPNAIAVPV